MSCDALFSTPDPPPSVHFGGTALVASAFGATQWSTGYRGGSHHQLIAGWRHLRRVQLVAVRRGSLWGLGHEGSVFFRLALLWT